MRLFRPIDRERREGDLVWVGNWGDGERTAELDEFLLEPVRRLRLAARVHGVRYPEHALRALAAAGIAYGGWLPNHRVPEVFARFAVTVHVPRRPYVEPLPGIPTIRVFEALACGIPLVSAPWDDVEGLFATRRHAVRRRCRADGPVPVRGSRRSRPRADARANGLATIRARHTCAHRVDELLGDLRRAGRGERAPARGRLMRIAFFGSSLVSAYWNGAATYYRGLLKALAERGHAITFYEPDAFERQAHRDIADPDWARVVVYPADAARRSRPRSPMPRRRTWSSRRAASACSTSCSRPQSYACGGPDRTVIFWDVDAPATLGAGRRRPARSVPRADPAVRSRPHLRRRRSGGRAPTAGSARATACRSTTRSIRRPTTRCRRTRASPPIWPSSATGCRTARRGSRSSSSSPPRQLPGPDLPPGRQRLGGMSICRPTCARSATSTRGTTTPSTSRRARCSTSTGRAWRATASRRRRGCSRRPAPAPA